MIVKQVAVGSGSLPLGGCVVGGGGYGIYRAVSSEGGASKSATDYKDHNGPSNSELQNISTFCEHVIRRENPGSGYSILDCGFDCTELKGNSDFLKCNSQSKYEPSK
ncbi:hypothetical protein MHLP_01285 [Candidatus Mycoplasma haematolamae str. Purdue]|uniref:Uncharacterized protein n=1 Tax=Mycoplasma haematolamae (strain Purdue) TaxID=1212765 RepID=I7C5P6_MYCHA|nr:hypothetical protein [Candidatus Mycoplasma haematolamae]AFO51837.1 hypothetical protein MHLP_01285 [Candidatus Mycoplasma haematolamae str. Purdue]